jgi:RimJ/RimL family protein N-acetyltransferase
VSEDLQVRPARPEDLAGWLELFDAVIAEGQMGREPPLDRDWARGWFTGSLVTDGQLRLVAVLDGEMVGSLLAEDSSGRVVSLGMFVASRARRQGVGRALIDAAITWTADRGAHKLHLEVWPHNDAAIRLYESVGFAREGLRRRHYRRRSGALWDSLIMGLVLDETSPGGP